MRAFTSLVIFLSFYCTHNILVSVEKPTVQQIYLQDGEMEKVEFDKGYFKQFLRFSNFPKLSDAVLLSKRVVSPRPQNEGKITFYEDGSYILTVSARGYLPGENATFQLINEKGEKMIETSLIPNPLTAKSENGTFTVSADLTLPTYFLTIPEASSKEIFTITSHTNGKTNSRDFFYYYGIDLFPGLKDIDGGVAQVTITRKVNGDKASLELIWGQEIPKHYMDMQLEAHPEWKDELNKLDSTL